MVLVDTSVYIRLLRARLDPVAELVQRFDSTEIVGCDLVRCEVLRGMIRTEERADLAAFFDVLVHAPMDRRAWRATEELAWKLDRAGNVLPLPDLIIAVCALHAGAALLTNDKHFSLIPQLRLASW